MWVRIEFGIGAIRRGAGVWYVHLITESSEEGWHYGSPDVKPLFILKGDEDSWKWVKGPRPGG